MAAKVLVTVDDLYWVVPDLVLHFHFSNPFAFLYNSKEPGAALFSGSPQTLDDLITCIWAVQFLSIFANMASSRTPIHDLIPWAVVAFLSTQFYARYSSNPGPEIELSPRGLARWAIDRVKDFQAVMRRLQVPVMALMLADAIPTYLGFVDSWRSTAIRLVLGTYLGINWWLNMFYPKLLTPSVNIFASLCQASYRSMLRTFSHYRKPRAPDPKIKEPDEGEGDCRRKSIGL